MYLLQSKFDELEYQFYKGRISKEVFLDFIDYFENPKTKEIYTINLN